MAHPHVRHRYPHCCEAGLSVQRLGIAAFELRCPQQSSVSEPDTTGTLCMPSSATRALSVLPLAAACIHTIEEFSLRRCPYDEGYAMRPAILLAYRDPVPHLVRQVRCGLMARMDNIILGLELLRYNNFASICFSPMLRCALV